MPLNNHRDGNRLSNSGTEDYSRLATRQSGSISAVVDVADNLTGRHEWLSSCTGFSSMGESLGVRSRRGGNQKTLLKTAQHCAQTQSPLRTFQESDLSHGRQVERTIRLFAASYQLQSQWKSLNTFVAVNRQGLRDGKPFNSDSWYMLSQIIPASQAAGLIRSHRASVENQIHWVKDVVAPTRFMARSSLSASRFNQSYRSHRVRYSINCPCLNF